MRKKIIIIGGGPAGYVAAIQAAQLGAEVHLAEMAALGGTCLNSGCIPTKTLLATAAFYHRACRSAVPGVKSSAELDWPAALAYKDAVVARLSQGVAALLRKNGVQTHAGRARLLPGFPGPAAQIGGETLRGDAVILATGSRGAAFAFTGSGLDGIIGSTEALRLEKPPASLAVVGGGVVGLEFATLFAHLGAEVSVVEAMPELLPAMDAEIAGLLRKKLSAAGIGVFTDTRLEAVEKAGGLLDIRVKTKEESAVLRAEKVLMATGRKPNTEDLGLEAMGAAMDRGALITDGDFRTNIPGLYAVGDCNAKCMLAHAAMDQGIAAVSHIMETAESGAYRRPRIIPGCVYTSPEIAAAGMTEEEVREKGIPYTVGRFGLSGNGRAVAEGEDGLVKILADKAYGEILWIHMIGPRVTELIAEPVLCMQMEGSAGDLASAVRAHPGIGEAIGEAARALFGKAIHSSG